jgi:uncharacterized protein YjbJ (UPF0337 family)
MDWEHLEADNWNRLGANLRGHWTKLTDADVESIAGKREHLIGRLRALYGMTERRAEAELRNWERHQDPVEPSWRAT